jgi:hypothetical protein
MFKEVIFWFKFFLDLRFNFKLKIKLEEFIFLNFYLSILFIQLLSIEKKIV